MDSFTTVFLPCSAPLVLVSLFAPCPFFPCAPTSLSGLTSPVVHLVSIHHNGLEVFSCILVFGSGQLAFQLLPGVRLCSLLPAHLNILNIFCESTSLLISYIYLLFSFTTMLDVSNQNRISKAGPILTLAWHIHNLTGKFIIGPNIDN